jgi:DNA polymerase-3 subunit gamma/tau
MPTQALYNKWRGQTFADILGQEHITTTLQNQIRAGRIGHAYLFTGLRGTGKTTTARIMAKAVNCTGETDTPPCNQCPICRSITEGRSLDLIEIDAASNRGIDEIRDLRDKVAFAPSECRFKVYVIDEVHMLTNEAFNALLKTLEEPPPHVIFILCTTEPYRLPDTVLSRCQRFDFRRGALPEIMRKLRVICEHEGIKIAPDALELIARRATGSFRDAESLLDQLAAYGMEEITAEQVRGILGMVSTAIVAEFARSLALGDVSTGIRLINQAMDNGAEPHQFLTEVLDYLRALMLIRAGGDDGLLGYGEGVLEDLHRLAGIESLSLDRVVRAIRLFNEAGNSLRTAARPQLPLELAFIEAALPAVGESETPPGDQASREAAAAARAEPEPGTLRVRREPPVAPEEGHAEARRAREVPQAQAPEVQGAAPTMAPLQGAGGDAVAEQAAPTYVESAAPPVEESVSGKEAPAASPEEAGATSAGPSGPEATTPSPILTIDWVRGKWRQALTRMKAVNPNVQAMLNSTRPIEVHGDMVTLGCEAAFHRDMLSEDKRRDLVERVLSEVMGAPCHVRCVVDAAPRQAASRERGADKSAPEDLFAPVDARESVRQKLLSHPAVKELEKRGGQVSKVSLTDEEQEGNRG